jgi:hypothetical protein
MAMLKKRNCCYCCLLVVFGILPGAEMAAAPTIDILIINTGDKRPYILGTFNRISIVDNISRELL